MNVYVENQNDIIHETSVDFILRPCAKEIHIVQYDKSLPIIKVYLFKNGEKYILPDNNIDAKLRIGKNNNTKIILDALGCSQSREAIYFEVSEMLASIYTIYYPKVELSINNKKVCSSSIKLFIDRNPMQNN